MPLTHFIERLRQCGPCDAIVWHDRVTSYDRLLADIEAAGRQIDAHGISPGNVVSIEADFSPASVALLLALVQRRCIVVPLARGHASNASLCEIAQVGACAKVDGDDGVELSVAGRVAEHPLYERLRGEGRPGLVVFTSGSTGTPKAIVHDFTRVLKKFESQRPPQRMITFLLFDHMGGMNTLLHILSSGGCVVTVRERSPEAVARAIERHRVETLPTSPTFLNLFLLSECYKRFDLGSLQMITYGTEPMPSQTLRKLREALPAVRLLQTYGLSEFGVMRSRSKDSDSLWVKVGGEGYTLRVVDNLLEIKSDLAMLGYLNAPSPFTADGWFRTGDEVEVDGEYMRILGRKSEVISVAGEKFYPSEVEGVLMAMDDVLDVTVKGEDHPLTGQVVVAHVKLASEESLDSFKSRMLEFCKERLGRAKVPRKIVLARAELHSDRFKKVRSTL